MARSLLQPLSLTFLVLPTYQGYEKTATHTCWKQDFNTSGKKLAATSHIPRPPNYRCYKKTAAHTRWKQDSNASGKKLAANRIWTPAARSLLLPGFWTTGPRISLQLLTFLALSTCQGIAEGSWIAEHQGPTLSLSMSGCVEAGAQDQNSEATFISQLVACKHPSQNTYQLWNANCAGFMCPAAEPQIKMFIFW